MKRPASSRFVPVLLACQLLVPSLGLAQTAPPPKPAAPAAPKPAAPAAPKPAAPPAPKPATPPAPSDEQAGPKDPPAAPPSDQPAAATPAPATTPEPASPPSPAATPLPLAEAPANPTSHPVQVVSTVPGLQLQVHRFELDDVSHGPTRDFAAFSDTCTAPCKTSLEPGAYQLAVQMPDGQRARANTGLLLEGPATVNIDMISHASTRREGLYWVLVGSALGAIATGVGLSQDCGPDHDCAKTAALGIWGGITVMSVSWLIGLPKMMTDDEPSVKITPGLAGGADQARTAKPRLAGAF